MITVVLIYSNTQGSSHTSMSCLTNPGAISYIHGSSRIQGLSHTSRAVSNGVYMAHLGAISQTHGPSCTCRGYLTHPGAILHIQGPSHTSRGHLTNPGAISYPGVISRIEEPFHAYRGRQSIYFNTQHEKRTKQVL